MPLSHKGSFAASIKGALKRGRLPEEVGRTLELHRAERILAHAPTRGGSYAVATSTALHLPAGEAAPGFVRLPWDRIEHASWKDGWLHVYEPGGRAEHHVRLIEPGSVPETVRERVTSTVVVDHQGRLAEGGRVRIVGRRGAGGDELHWAFVFEPGLDAEDPGLRAQAEELLADLRRQTGL
ncbi:MAG: hypothetical protein JWO67_6552 [Streptosporangiaceae bacterium]|jgi:hypothetical protein|nr:hypothetical protein [Streptosporangiaceae bacterium]